MPRITIISIVAKLLKTGDSQSDAITGLLFAEERLYFLKGMVARDLMNGWQASA